MIVKRMHKLFELGSFAIKTRKSLKMQKLYLS